MANIWFDQNTHSVTLKELKDKTGAFVNVATVVCRMLDMTGAELEGVLWPIAMPYNGNGDGTYEGSIPKDIEAEQGEMVRLEVTAVSGGLNGQWDCDVRIQKRGC